MTCRNFLGDFIERNSAKSRHGSGEKLIYDFTRQSNRFKNLCTRVRSNRRHAHLRHNLEHTFARSFDVVLNRLLGVKSTQPEHSAAIAGIDHVFNSFKSQIRIYRPRAVTNQQSHVMHLACVTRFDNQTHHGALLLTNQMMVNRARQQQRRDWCKSVVAVAI